MRPALLCSNVSRSCRNIIRRDASLKLLRENAPAIASLFPPAGLRLDRIRAGSSRKARILLGRLRRRSRLTCRSIFPAIFCQPGCGAIAPAISRTLRFIRWSADFTQNFVIPVAIAALPRVGFFPGSTIGNFEPHEAAKFLRHAGAILGHGAVLVIGVDLVKDTKIFCPAYNCAEGVTAKFNLNLLAPHQWRAWRQFRPWPPSSITPVTTTSTTGSRCTSPAAKRQKVEDQRQDDRFPRRRNHPYREQLQIQPRSLHRTCAEVRAGRRWKSWTDPAGMFSVHALVALEQN